MKTIFIVDDNDTNLMAAKAVLEVEGKYKSYALPSAEKMFKLAEKIMPDLILLDIQMPEMDGFEALQILKSNEKLKSIPVILFTARQCAHTKKRGFELGALDYIIKPFSPPLLLELIEKHIGKDGG